MEMAARKKDIRNNAGAKRKALCGADRMRMDRDLYQNFLSLYQAGFISYDRIYTYVSTEDEADTRQIIHYLLAAGRQVAVPKVSGRQMDFYYIRSLKELIPGFMGILEPKEGAVKAKGGGLCLVPGLAFDQEGYRVGYGGGYYDRFLRTFTGPALGLCHEWQMMAAVPREPFDIAVSKVVTDKHIYE